MIKEINRNTKKISEINSEELPDYTEDFKNKVDINADNIGYGTLFKETEDYTTEDNLIDWGSSLTNKDNKIEADNKKLVSSQNVYDETHPYMEKDGNGDWINPYNYINYKNLISHEGAVDINKQDRWSEQDFFQPNEPNDNTVKENLVALDTAVYEVSEALKELNEKKANINLDNLTKKDPNSTTQDNTLYGQTVLMNSTHIVSDHENVFVNYEDVYNPNIRQWVRVYHIDTDIEQSGGGSYIDIYSSDNSIDIYEYSPYSGYSLYDITANLSPQLYSDQTDGIRIRFGDIKQYQQGEEILTVSGQKVFDEVKLTTAKGHFINDEYITEQTTVQRQTTGEKLSILDDVLAETVKDVEYTDGDNFIRIRYSTPREDSSVDPPVQSDYKDITITGLDKLQDIYDFWYYNKDILDGLGAISSWNTGDQTYDGTLYGLLDVFRYALVRGDNNHSLITIANAGTYQGIIPLLERFCNLFPPYLTPPDGSYYATVSNMYYDIHGSSTSTGILSRLSTLESNYTALEQRVKALEQRIQNNNNQQGGTTP